MKRDYSLLTLALLLSIGCAFCFVHASDPGLRCTLGCTYNGFSQSVIDPNSRGPAKLNIVTQTTDGVKFKYLEFEPLKALCAWIQDSQLIVQFWG